MRLYLLPVLGLLAGCAVLKGGHTTPQDVLGRHLVEANYSGVQVLQKTAGEDKSVAVRVLFTGGVQQYSAAQDGIEALALRTALYGSTQELGGQAIQQKLRALGITLGVSTGPEYSEVSLRCLDKHFNTAWDLLMQLLLTPAFDVDEFAAIQEAYAASRLVADSTLEHRKAVAVLQLLPSGHPLTRNPQGTATSIRNLSKDSVQAYYARLLRLGRIRLVVVGPPTDLKLHNRIIGTLNLLPPDKTPVLATWPSLSLAEKPLFASFPQTATELRALAVGPVLETVDGVAFQLALALLEERMVHQLVASKGLATAAQVNFTPAQRSYAELRLVTERAPATVIALKALLQQVRTEGFTTAEVEEKKAALLTRYYAALQDNIGQADLLATAFARANWRQAVLTAPRLKALTATVVNQAAARYLATLQWAYLGNTATVGHGIFDF